MAGSRGALGPSLVGNYPGVEGVPEVVLGIDLGINLPEERTEPRIDV